MVFNSIRLDEPVSFPKEKSEWHYCLKDRVDDALKAREYIDNLPDTAATFRVKNMGLDLEPSEHVNQILYLLGAWQMPEPIESTARGQQWINPNYHDAHRYAEPMVRCECGCIVAHEHFGGSNPQPAETQEHGDCSKLDRMDARVRLAKNRKAVIERGVLSGNHLSQLRPRLGLTGTKRLSNEEFEERYGVDGEELWREGRTKVAKTLMVLCREYKPGQIGSIYGIGRKGVTDILNAETEADPMKFYRLRKRGTVVG